MSVGIARTAADVLRLPSTPLMSAQQYTGSQYAGSQYALYHQPHLQHHYTPQSLAQQLTGT
eukprot:581403-Rhodomonas_salina.1